MKMKQPHIKAVFGERVENAKNYGQEKETVSTYKIIDKVTESVVVDCRVYSGRSRNSSTLYASIWVRTSPKCKAIPCGYTSGKGDAGGYGYHKESAAIAYAIENANISLVGSPYPNVSEVDFKKSARIGGTGCHVEALQAIAYAAGYNNCILVCC